MNTSMTAIAHAEIFQRSVAELCELVGYANPGLLLDGGKFRIDDYTVSLIHDESYSPSELFVYIDMGPAKAEDKEGGYKVLLKINFELLAGSRGAISIHPQTDHVFYAFRYKLDASSSGRNLLDTLIRFVGDVGIEALDLPMELQGQSAASRGAGQAKMARLIKGNDGGPKPKQ